MYLVFDIGGTYTRVATYEQGSGLDRLDKFPTPQNFDEAVAKIVDSARKLSAGQPITAAAGGVAGVLDHTRSMMIKPAHLSQWDRRPLKAELETRLGVNVTLENDSALMALGEAAAGAGRGFDLVAFIGIGTGVGGARVEKKQISPHQFGFEPGHHVITAGQEPDYWESYISGSGLRKRYGLEKIESASAEILEQIHTYITLGLYNVSLFWSPQVIILGGGIGNLDVIDVNKIQTQLQQLNAERGRLEGVPQVARAQLADRGGLVGALQLLAIDTI